MKKLAQTKKTNLQLIKFILTLLFLALIFISLVSIKKNAFQEIENNVQICLSLAKHANRDQRQSFVEQCKIYLGTPCTKHNQCGPFPCINKECYIKHCTTDSDCQESLCGQYLTPIHNFCTTTDVK